MRSIERSHCRNSILYHQRFSTKSIYYLRPGGLEVNTFRLYWLQDIHPKVTCQPVLFAHESFAHLLFARKGFFPTGPFPTGHLPD